MWWMVKLVLKVSQVMGEEEGAETKKVIEVLEYMRHHSAPVPRSMC